MRTLVVSTYPPKHCGIAKYAAQQVEALRSEGHEVRVMSVDGEGEVDYPFRLTDPGDVTSARRIFSQFDRVIVHYTPGLIAPDSETRELFHKSLRRAARFQRKTRFEIRVHEMAYPADKELRKREERFWRSPSRLQFHTAHELDLFIQHYPRVARDRLEIVEHGRDMRTFYQGSRTDARAELGLDPNQVAFVSCGFVQDTKGFDRVVEIFAHNPDLSPTAHYHIVGSARTSDFIPYRDRLEQAAERVVGVTFHNEYVDDESFDRWIVAADYILAPYRHISSSGLLARAALYDRHVVATDVGGLRDQVRTDDTVVANDEELARAIETLALRTPVSPSVPPSSDQTPSR